MDSDQLKRRRCSSANPSSSFPPSSKKPRTSLVNPSNLDGSSGSSQATAHLSSDIQALGSASQAPIGQFEVAPNCNTQRSADQPNFGNMDSMSSTFLGRGSVMDMGVGGVDPATGANTALAETQSFPDTYLKPFKDFNQAITTLTKIHPYARMALGMLVAISQMFVVQQTRDERVSRLLETVRKVYEFLTEETTLKEISGKRETFAKIALMTSGAVQFIKNYSATVDFWKRSGKDVEYQASDVSIAYTEALDDLMQQYRNHEDRGVQVDAFRVLEELELEGFARARGVGVNWTKRCLDGTRTEILTDIINWIYDTAENVPRILWLHGQAGKGKSAIAHTIALWFKNIGGVGSCFCFSRDWQAEHLEEQLIRTVSWDLAERDPAFRRALADAVAKDDVLKTTSDIVLQWKRLISEPLHKISGHIVGNVLVVVDALDESGGEASRRHLLSVLASAQTAELPRNVRILVTSRTLPDIEHVLNAAQHVRLTSLDDVSTGLSERDVRLYIMKKVGHLRGVGSAEVHAISQKAEGLFEWARLACEFVNPGAVKNGSVKERVDNVMNLRSGGGLLDAMYRAILEDSIPKDETTLTQFHSVMQQIMSALEPLHLNTLNKMRSHFPDKQHRYDIIAILESMAPLLGGITDRSCPVRPLHASFYDFLMDRSRSGVYFIDTSDGKDLAFATLQILRDELQFNICGLESSYLANAEVPDLSKRIKENIPHHLSYSSQFWGQHLQKTAFDLALVVLVKVIVGGEKILFWLEIISLLGMVGKGVDALGTVVTWLQGQHGFKDVLALVEDGIKLIRNFGSVMEHSTPHLYASALPFIPSNALLSMILLPKFPRLARVALGGLKGWPVEQQLLQGHTNVVLSVAFSPDGRRIASGSRDGTVRIWDVEGGVQIGSPLEGHTLAVNSVAFSPDGKRIVSGSWDKTVRVWDVEGGVQIGSPLEGHTSFVCSVAFSPDGKRIVSGSVDKTVRVWDIEGGAQIGSPLEGHTSWVNLAAFSPGKNRLVSGSGDHTVRVWENEMFAMVASHPFSILHPFPPVDGVKGYPICFSFDPSHALLNCNPLVDGFMQQNAVLGAAVKLHDDGWIKGPKGQLLLWIPPKLRRPFYSMWTTAVFPRGHCIELDLSQMVHGKEWCKCFHITR